MADNTNGVNHPNYYNFGKIEVIEVIEDWGMGFHVGNCIKYISRAGKKNIESEKKDLEKALWYLKRFAQIADAWTQPPFPFLYRVRNLDRKDMLVLNAKYSVKEVIDDWKLPEKLATMVFSLSQNDTSTAILLLEEYIKNHQ